MINRLTRRQLTIAAMVVAFGAGRAPSQDNVTDPPPVLPVWGLSFSPDGTLLAAAAGVREESGVVIVWEAADWASALTLEEQSAPTCAAFSPDGATLLVGTNAAHVLLVDVAEWNVRRRWNALQGAVNGATWTPDGERVLTAGSDGTIRVWDAASGELRQTLNTWTSAGSEPPAQPVDPENPPDPRLIWDVAVSPDGTKVVSGGWGDTTRLWDLSTGEQILSFPGTDELVQGVAFTPDGRHFIASVQRTADVFVRETETGLEAMALRAVGGRDVAIHPEGRLLAIAGRQRAVVYELNLKIPTDEDIERYQEIIAKFEDDDVEVREAASEEVLAIGPPIAPLLFDAIQAPGAETRMRARWLWNKLRESEPIAEMTGHDGELRQAAFSPDGRLLVTAGKGGDVRIWSVPEFELQQTLRVSAIQN